MAEKLYGNRWKIIETIGEGGQGQVFIVEDLKDENKSYVLKKLKNSKRINRFKSEIETIEKLRHPNIVNLVDFDLECSKPYFVTDYCAGGELTFDKVSKLSVIEKLELFSVICRTVGYAHENGVVHRDIKPPNILLQSDERTPVITDFGICFNTEEGLERLTETMEQAGSRFFMPPELADGRAEDISPATDIYTLGKLLYWMFKGEVFDREESNGVKKFNLPKWDLKTDKEINNSIQFIYDIFDKTIEENPLNRFQDANELGFAVEKIISVLKNNGRYLDASTPTKCIFCGVGYYSKKNIVPKIRKMPPSYDPGRVQDYQIDYSLPHLQLFSSEPKTLPEGNIKQGLYSKYLILTCDHCGNFQLFNVGQEGSQNWKNVEPKTY